VVTLPSNDSISPSLVVTMVGFQRLLACFRRRQALLELLSVVLFEKPIVMDAELRALDRGALALASVPQPRSTARKRFLKEVRSLREAKRTRADLLSDLRNRREVPTNRVTLSELAIEWLESRLELCVLQRSRRTSGMPDTSRSTSVHDQHVTLSLVTSSSSVRLCGTAG
jgi:hypothetical protein